jgi:hypothetical protein
VVNKTRGDKMKITKGDTVVIQAQGIKVKGEVLSADNWGGKDGWYIELTKANVPGGYSYWKQGQDGGKLIEVRGHKVKDCVFCKAPTLDTICAVCNEKAKLK